MRASGWQQNLDDLILQCETVTVIQDVSLTQLHVSIFPIGVLCLAHCVARIRAHD